MKNYFRFVPCYFIEILATSLGGASHICSSTAADMRGMAISWVKHHVTSMIHKLSQNNEKLFTYSMYEAVNN